MKCTITVVVTNPKTFKKEVYVDGKLVQVIYPPKGYSGGW
jgi:hypothetical protein